MRRTRTSLIVVAVTAVAVVALAFVVAPRSCAGGLELYFGCGVAVAILLSALPFIARLGHAGVARVAIAFGFLAVGMVAWLAGLFIANVRFICGLGYL